MRLNRTIFVILLLVASLAARAQENLQASDYSRTEQMIPMRDGVHLHTVIFAPKTSAHPLPFLFERTPYGVSEVAIQALPQPLLSDGMILVLQDIRGRYGSEGTFVMMRPTHFNSDAKVDEGTDAYDTIDWLVKNVPHNNGRAAILGVSYDGWTALQAAVQPHPALKLAVPMASPLDMWMNDDFHRYGAFRLSYGFEYSYMMESSKENEQFDFHGKDAYDYYLQLGSLSNVNPTVFHNKLPTWNAFVEHPNHDYYWSSQSVANLLEEGPKLPIINVGGYWDQEDPWGPQESYRLLAKHDPHHRNHIVLGPWNHGGWMGRASHLGPIEFGSETGTYFKTQILYPAILHYLKDRPMPELPAATVFVTGSNQWRTFDQWPPKGGPWHVQYLERGGVLAGNAKLHPERWHNFHNETGAAVATYVSDPSDPVPYRKRPIEATYDPKGSGWYTWQVQDQSFLDGRKDVVTFSTDALAQDETYIGRAEATLLASTSGTDSDWIVKLIDQYPANDPTLPNYKLPIAMEITRPRFNVVVGPLAQPIVANLPLAHTLDLHAIAHTFMKGHKIVVQVQSTWFPLIDRNPQTFVENIFLAKSEDFKAATQTLYEPSRIKLPVVAK